MLTQSELKVIRLTFLDHFEQLLIPILREFRARWPQVQTQLLASDRMYDLARGEVDIGVRGRDRPTSEEIVVRELPPSGWTIYASAHVPLDERPHRGRGCRSADSAHRRCSSDLAYLHLVEILPADEGTPAAGATIFGQSSLCHRVRRCHFSATVHDRGLRSRSRALLSAAARVRCADLSGRTARSAPARRRHGICSILSLRISRPSDAVDGPALTCGRKSSTRFSPRSKL